MTDSAHKGNCYDDEGRLNCCCRIGAAEDVAWEEGISRAEAERLIELHFLEAMGMVLNASLPKPEAPPVKEPEARWHDHWEDGASREYRGLMEDDEQARRRGF
jgi:hypothetical protein